MSAIEQLLELGERAPWRLLRLSERQSVFTLVDAIYYPTRLYNISWKPRGRHKLYAKRNTGPERSTVYLHREIMEQADPRSEGFMLTHVVDHMNGQTLDNRLVNLRWLTPEENRLHVTPRECIPSLENIVRALLAELERDRQDTFDKAPFNSAMEAPPF